MGKCGALEWFVRDIVGGVPALEGCFVQVMCSGLEEWIGLVRLDASPWRTHDEMDKSWLRKMSNRVKVRVN